MSFVFVTIVFLFFTFSQALVLPDVEQFAIFNEADTEIDAVISTSPIKNGTYPKRIVIIGSGITGATTAFKLAESFRRRAPQQDNQPSITVFERNEVVGGRITQAFAYNDSRYPVDTCAQTFSAQDTCISEAIQNVGLTPRFSRQDGKGVGVWDANKQFVGFIESKGFRNPQSWSLYRKLKWYKRYGDQPQTSSFNARNVRLMFNRVLRSSLNPDFEQAGQGNLRESVQQSGLLDYVQNFVCAGDAVQRTFPSGSKAKGFVDEVLIAAQRDRFFGTVGDLSALEFFFGYENQFESSVQGGNLRLIERLLKLATNDVRLGTEVKKIEQQLNGTLVLTTEDTGTGRRSEDSFDAVIIATSLERSGIEFGALDGVVGLGQKYKDSFVTHFTSTTMLDPKYFNLTREFEQMPQVVLTTQTANNIQNDIEPPFFSLQLINVWQPPNNPDFLEFQYRIVSRKEIPDSEIVKMIYLPDRSFGKGITWIDRQSLPQSIPVIEANPDQCKTLLERIEVAPNVYYAGAGEQVVGSAEFGCRMGANVANLIVDGERDS